MKLQHLIFDLKPAVRVIRETLAPLPLPSIMMVKQFFQGNPVPSSQLSRAEEVEVGLGWTQAQDGPQVILSISARERLKIVYTETNLIVDASSKSGPRNRFNKMRIGQILNQWAILAFRSHQTVEIVWADDQEEVSASFRPSTISEAETEVKEEAPYSGEPTTDYYMSKIIEKLSQQAKQKRETV